MAFDKQASAGYLTNHMARLFARGLHDRIRPLGLAPAQFAVLLELWAGDGLTQKELVERLDVEQATMANTLARMQRDRLIERKPHPDDRRSQLVWLTDAALALEGDAVAAAIEVNQAVLEGLPSAERDLFLRMLGRVVSGMRDQGGEDRG